MVTGGWYRHRGSLSQLPSSCDPRDKVESFFLFRIPLRHDTRTAVWFLDRTGRTGTGFGEAARTEFFGGLGIRTFYGRTEKTKLLRDGDEINDPNAREVLVNVVPVAVVYGALPKLSLITIVPVVDRSFDRTTGGQRLSETDTGIGDVTLLAKYRFYKKDAFLKSRQFAVQFGLKLPTGDDDGRDAQGARLPQPVQLGTGAVDAPLTLTFTEVRNRLLFSGDVGYTLRTEANDFEFGDVFNYDLAVKFRFYPAKFVDSGPFKQHFVFLELNGRASGRARAGGAKLADSGGHELFVAPGLQLFLLENVLIEGGVQIPVLQDLNGTQLGTDFNFRAGVRWIMSL